MDAVFPKGFRGPHDDGRGESAHASGSDDGGREEAGNDVGAAAADAGAEGKQADNELDDSEDTSDDVHDFSPFDNDTEGLNCVGQGSVGEVGAIGVGDVG